MRNALGVGQIVALPKSAAPAFPRWDTCLHYQATMDSPSPSMRSLARRLLVIEAVGAARARGADARVHEAVRVCEKLRTSLTRFAGAEGFTSLLRRTLALARVEAPSLNRITVMPDCSMDGLEALVADDTDGGVEAVAVLTAHILGLLETFIGESLALRLVRDAWPDEALDE